MAVPQQIQPYGAAAIGEKRATDERNQMAIWGLMLQGLMNQQQAGAQHGYNMEELQERGRQAVALSREQGQITMERDTHLSKLSMNEKAFTYAMDRAIAKEDLFLSLMPGIAVSTANASLGEAFPDQESLGIKKAMAEHALELDGYKSAAMTAINGPAMAYLTEQNRKEQAQLLGKAMGTGGGIGTIDVAKSLVQSSKATQERLDLHAKSEELGRAFAANVIAPKIQALDPLALSDPTEITKIVASELSTTGYAGLVPVLTNALSPDFAEQNPSTLTNALKGAGGSVNVSVLNGILAGVGDTVSSQGGDATPISEAVLGIRTKYQAGDERISLGGKLKAFQETNQFDPRTGLPFNLSGPRAFVSAMLQTPEGASAFKEGVQEWATMKGVQIDPGDVDSYLAKSASNLEHADPNGLYAQFARAMVPASQELEGQVDAIVRQEKMAVAKNIAKNIGLRRLLNARDALETAKFVGAGIPGAEKLIARQERDLQNMFKMYGVDMENPYADQKLAENLITGITDSLGKRQSQIRDAALKASERATQQLNKNLGKQAAEREQEKMRNAQATAQVKAMTPAQPSQPQGQGPYMDGAGGMAPPQGAPRYGAGPAPQPAPMRAPGQPPPLDLPMGDPQLQGLPQGVGSNVDPFTAVQQSNFLNPIYGSPQGGGGN